MHRSGLISSFVFEFDQEFGSIPVVYVVEHYRLETDEEYYQEYGRGSGCFGLDSRHTGRQRLLQGLPWSKTLYDQ